MRPAVGWTSPGDEGEDVVEACRCFDIPCPPPRRRWLDITCRRPLSPSSLLERYLRLRPQAAADRRHQVPTDPPQTMLLGHPVLFRYSWRATRLVPRCMSVWYWVSILVARASIGLQLPVGSGPETTGRTALRRRRCGREVEGPSCSDSRTCLSIVDLSSRQVPRKYLPCSGYSNARSSMSLYLDNTSLVCCQASTASPDRQNHLL